MPPSDRVERILRWLERQQRWISSTDLHRWQQANLGSSRSKRAHDLRALVESGQVERREIEARRFEYRIARPAAPAPPPPHVVARLRIEAALAKGAPARASVGASAGPRGPVEPTSS